MDSFIEAFLKSYREKGISITVSWDMLVWAKKKLVQIWRGDY